jgi:hypothetical protein
MTTVKTKPEPKAATPPPKEKGGAGDDMRIAYEIHTLSQLLFREIYAADPRMAPASPPVDFSYTPMTPPSMPTGSPSRWTVPTIW